MNASCVENEIIRKRRIFFLPSRVSVCSIVSGG